MSRPAHSPEHLLLGAVSHFAAPILAYLIATVASVLLLLDASRPPLAQGCSATSGLSSLKCDATAAASSFQPTTVGQGAQTTGSNSTSLGQGSGANGSCSTTFGASDSATGSSSVTIGMAS